MLKSLKVLPEPVVSLSKMLVEDPGSEGRRSDRRARAEGQIGQSDTFPLQGRSSETALLDFLSSLRGQSQRSPFRDVLATVATAFDAELMREHLQVALVRENYTIEQCQPGKAAFLPQDGGCVLRYKLRIKDDQSGEVLTALLNVRIFSSLSTCQAYTRDRLMPLATQMNGRSELAPFATPVAVLEALNMAVSVFPIDGELPMLVAATDPQIMRQVLRKVLVDGPNNAKPPCGIEDCRIEIGHYGRQHRCVLRYHTGIRRSQREASPWDSDEIEQKLIYGKVAADNRGLIADKAIKALRQRLLDNGSQQFNIPQSLGFWPDLQLALLESIPGKPQLKQLLESKILVEDPRSEVEDAERRSEGRKSDRGDRRARAEGQIGQIGLTLEGALDACAQIAATLHTSDITLGHRRTLDDELAGLRSEIFAIQPLLPELGRQLQLWLDQIEAYSQASDPLPLCFSHGDFTYTQLLFAPDHHQAARPGLVDFDTVCQAEPALDLGHFTAYMRLAILKAFSTKAPHEETLSPEARALTEQLYARFLDTYLTTTGNKLTPLTSQGDEAQLRARVAVYEVVSLLRIALHSWQKLKGGRLNHSLIILKEVMSCLP